MDLLKTYAVVVFFSVFCALHIANASTEVDYMGSDTGELDYVGAEAGKGASADGVGGPGLEPITKKEHERAKNYYDSVYTSAAARALYSDNVGLEKGAGPWQDFYKPKPLHMYWFPSRHYVRPEGTYYDQLLEKYKASDCIACHEEVTPGIVYDWRASTHADPKKNEYFAIRTRQIEQLIERDLENVDCSECHGKDHKELHMPTPDICGNCHPKQVNEYLDEMAYGRPNHVDTFTANVVPPWYPEAARQGYLTSMFGCDYCHGTTEKCDICHTRHKFTAEEGRRPEACESCHMGFDHPDSESYMESKMGKIYEMEGDEWDWGKPLGEVIPGKDYRTPTCQFCHMYQSEGKFVHTLAAKGIWRMGTVPPKSYEFKSSLKNYPYGVKLPPLDKKLDIYSEANRKNREQWIEMCSNCHSPRWGRLYLENLDDMMFEMWKIQDRAHLLMDELAAANAFDPPVSERDPFPMGEVLADALGPGLLGEGIYNAFKTTGGKLPVYGPILGVYTVFMAGRNNPSVIENIYTNMWFGDKAHAYKGTAHVQQDISWWYGASKAFQSMNAMESEAQKLYRAQEVDKLLGKKERKRSAGMIGGIIVFAGILLVGGMVVVVRIRKKD
jgi:hydroxylamine dehydrogenase